jgi:formate-dependent nitrite reductase cytochrome c552 subunit
MKNALVLAFLLATTESVQETNDRLAAQVMKSIAGHENEPAEQVFMDIRVESLKRTPAATFVKIMNGGYSKALGVACTHCHDEKDFSSDAKRPKRAAREMAAMHRTINNSLQAMTEAATPKEKRFINCATCHQGKINPLE